MPWNKPYQSATSPECLREAEKWLSESGELLVLIRIHASAGNREYELFENFLEYESFLARLPSRTSVMFFRLQRWFMKGVVNDTFIQNALSAVTDGGEDWLLLELGPIVDRAWRFSAWGNTHDELIKDLHSCAGKRVAVGLHPHWVEDNENMIVCVAPELDGTVRVGTY